MKIEQIKIQSGSNAISSTPIHSTDVVELVTSHSFAWIDIEIRPADEKALTTLLVEQLDFHPATVEDCLTLSPYHQPKLDEEQGYKFISFLFYVPGPQGRLEPREVNLYIGDTYVITLHHMPFTAFMDMLRRVPQTVREYPQHAIMFVHHILDVIVDSYKALLNGLQRRSDELELSVLEGRQRRLLRLNILKRGSTDMAEMRQILYSRQSLVILRRTLASELAIVNHIIKEFHYEGATEESEEIALYFSDIADHIRKSLEIIEEEQHNYDHIMEMHALVSNHRTNEIVYVLTIVSAIMLPLNLIVGFWGMNFDNLWFSHSNAGIWIVASFMILFTSLLLSLFRYKGWV